MLEKVITPVLQTLLLVEVAGPGSPDRVFSWVYHLLWIYPVYALSSLLSMVWHQSVANATYKLLNPSRKKNNPRPAKALFSMLEQAIYNQLLTLMLYVQMFLVSFVPLAGSTLSFLHLCLLYSLSSFAYKWEFQNIQLEKRVHDFESNWAYYAGFGMPLALVTVQFPWLVSCGLYTLTAPIYIILAILASPTDHSSGGVTSEAPEGKAGAAAARQNVTGSSDKMLVIYYIPDLMARALMKFFFARRLKKR